MKRHVTIFGTSLNPGSRSQVLAREALRQLTSRGVSATLVDLRDLALPESGRGGAGHAPDVQAVRAEAKRASHILFAVAIYNYDVSSAAKNLIELLSDDELTGKTVGFLCAAGGKNSYMSVLSFANSLMLDFRCWVAPRFVYATSGDFHDGKVVGEDVLQRITQLTTEMFAREGE